MHNKLKVSRINTCRSLSKQVTLTIFRMNTYEKLGGVVVINPTAKVKGEWHDRYRICVP